MTKVELKTKKNNQSVAQFLNSITDQQKRKDAKTIDKIIREITNCKPKMWGSSIVGYGEYDYTYASGREGTWMRLAFSPRQANLTLYIMPGYQFDDMQNLLEKLGPHKTGKSCLYIKRLDDIHMPTLKKLIKQGWKYMEKKYPK